jgi:hypothetical protein
MPTLTKYEYNLIAELLEERARFCWSNEYQCREELYAPAVESHWREQYVIASDLAIKFREEGK